MTDDRLERLISDARRRMVSADTREDRLQAYEDMRWLIAQRSPEQVERMERERGLR